MMKKQINPYSLPINWDKREIMSFGELSSAIEQIHFESQSSSHFVPILAPYMLHTK